MDTPLSFGEQKVRIYEIAVIVAFVSASPLRAQPAANARTTRPEVPAIVTRGLEAYRASGLSGAVDVWLAGSPVADNATAKAGMLTGLAPIETVFGKMIGWDIVDVIEVSAHVRRVYVVVRLEGGPLYGFFDCYQKASNDWIIPGMLFNAKAQEILPPRYLGG